MATTPVTAAARALKERQRNRKLPTVEIPQVQEDELFRSLQGIQEHLRMYEGDSGAPKERFVTIAELENSGLLKADVKGRFAYISQVLQQDVAQTAGSTANPTITESNPADTSRTSRTPGGGSSSAQSATATSQRLNDSQDVNVANPAKNEFLYYDGNRFTNFPLFSKSNTWLLSQKFDKPLSFREQAAGPAVLEGLGYLWVKDGSPNTIWFTDSAGTETQLGVGGGGGLDNIVEDTSPQLGGTLDANGWQIDMGDYVITDDKVNEWDTAYGWGDHAGLYGSDGDVTANNAKVTNATHTGQVTGSGALSLAVAAITGQTAGTTISANDELLYNDGGVLKRVDISVLDAHYGYGDTTPSVGSSYVYNFRDHDTSPVIYARQAGAGPIARFFSAASGTSSATEQCEILNDGGIDADGTVTDDIGSDSRIKNTITPIPNALKKLSKLTGVSFYLNDPVNKKAAGLQYGFIAQDMKKAMPELVHTRKKRLHIRRKGFEVQALLVEAIKELNKKVDGLVQSSPQE